MRATTWRAAALCLLWAGLALGDEAPSPQSGLVGVDASDPQYLVYEVRQLEVVLAKDEAPAAKPDSERQLREKEQLLQRMDKKHGTWNEHHPRHRLLEALRGFSAYAEVQQAEISRLKGLYSHVPKKQKKVLEREIKYSEKFTDIEQLLKKNQNVCNDIVRAALDFYGVDQHELDQHIQSMKTAGRGAEKVSVSQSLKHFVRDWAATGANERDAAFPCILKTLKDLFPSDQQNENVKVLLPGAGVGRLGHEVARIPGFQVTNNEWSMYQNVAYRFLTDLKHPHQHPNTTIFHPFVDSWSHHRSTADMLRPILIPDTPIDRSAVVLVEGDFTTAFRDEPAGAYDVVVTHFFIDTARNMMAYFDTIARLLRPGGYWINFGPLLYGSAPFVQLSLDEIVKVVEAMGFEFLEVPGGCGGREEVVIPGSRVYGVEAVYGFDERALTRNAYEALFWIARRGK